MIRRKLRSYVIPMLILFLLFGVYATYAVIESNKRLSKVPDNHVNDTITRKELPVLNELETYKELYISTLGHSLNNSIKQNNKHNNDLEALNKGWKIELEKKDKIIKNQSYTNKKMRKKLDGYRKLLKLKERHLSKKNKIINAMASYISRFDNDETICKGIDCYDQIYGCRTCIKQYYERKVKDERR
jgi:hypothetical protein